MGDNSGIHPQHDGNNGRNDLLEMKEIAFLAGKHLRTVQRWAGWPGFPTWRRTRTGHRGYPRPEVLNFIAEHGHRFRCSRKHGRQPHRDNATQLAGARACATISARKATPASKQEQGPNTESTNGGMQRNGDGRR